MRCRNAGLGAALCFNFDNIRYVTGTHIGEWARDKFMRYALCPVEGPPFLWDPAPPAKRISSPRLKENVAAPVSTMQGALPPSSTAGSSIALMAAAGLMWHRLHHPEHRSRLGRGNDQPARPGRDPDGKGARTRGSI